MNNPKQTYFEKAIEDGHLRLEQAGRFERIYYVAVSRSERWSDAEEKVTIENSVAFDKFIQPEERVAAAALSPAGTMLSLIHGATNRACAAMLARFYDPKRRTFKWALAEQELQSLKVTSDDLLSRTANDYAKIRQELGSSWSEILFLDGLFSEWDPIIAATMEMLTQRKDVVDHLPPRIKGQISHVLSINVAGGTGMNFQKAYSVPLRQFSEGQDPRVQFFSPHYHAAPDEDVKF